MSPIARPFFHLSLLAVLLTACPGFAQRGNRAGHVMTPPPEKWNIPAPPLSPEEALKSFQFGEEGFRIELVAAEPLIINPVCLAFDGNGRPWVCEMRGYMPNLDGVGEDEPNGRIVILEDRDGDGRADEVKVFIDGIVLPRAIQHVEGGILWGDQSKLYFTERRDDDTAGETTVVDDRWATSGNVEHKTNGLIHGLDNWLYNAKSGARYRKIGEKWIKADTENRGQWGIAQDDFGRLVTNSNSNLIDMESLPPGYRDRNPNHAFRTGGSARMSNDVWPVRITCGVNRGYQKGTLTKDGRLAKATGACGLTIYRGDQFPDEYYGNAFIPEPCGLLMKRAVISEDAKGGIKVAAAYKDREFLGSTDERSRFVNTYTAPDGSLYVVDIVHGIIQHKTYVTTYLRNQLEKRGLDKNNNDRGRVYRIRWIDKQLAEPPRMEEQSSIDLVAHLSHANGWWRDTAQRLIVQRGDDSCAPALRKVLPSPGAPWQASVHALWCLEGLGVLAPPDVESGAGHPHPKVRATAVRVAASFAGTGNEADAVEILAGNSDLRAPMVAPYLAATLGGFRDQGKVRAQAALVELLKNDDRLTRDMAMSSLDGAELEMAELAVKHDLAILDDLVPAVINWEAPQSLAQLLALTSTPTLDAKRAARLFTTIGRATIEKRHPASARVLLAQLEGDLDKDFRAALIAGMEAGGKVKGFKKIALSAKPESLDPALKNLFDFSGKKPQNFITTAEHRRLYDLGKAAYETYCIACHQPHGKGMTPLAPPLADSEWVLGSERRLIALTMEGMEGPVTVNGQRYEVPDIQPEMPGLRSSPDFTDEKIAAVLTYVRNTWDNHAPPVDPKSVKAWRDGEEERGAFTEEELKEIE